MNAAVIDSLLRRQRPGHALEQGFYVDHDVFEKEIPAIFLKSWLLVGHASRIPQTGDYFIFRMAGESIIVVRSGNERINALVNVCRHRGSRVCLEEQGRARRFVCPYHAWTYDLDGRLLGAPQVNEIIDVGDYPLHHARLENYHGLLFVNFDLNASFDTMAADFDAVLAPYEIENTKVAHRQNYCIDANWKLAIENYCECYHCVPAHREFAVGHGRARPETKVAELRASVIERAGDCGLSSRLCSKAWNKGVPLGTERYVDRYPLLKGHVTGSRDGQPLAPLLGSVRDYDGGATEFQAGPVSYGLVYCDHIVLYRFTPIDTDTTDCEISWLVRDSAVDGRDYSVQDLIWMWDVTTIADKKIIQDNARGVESRFYEPGPFTPMEYYTQQFTEWYLDIMRS